MKNTTEGIEAYRTAANNVLAAAESATTFFGILELVVEWALAITEISTETNAGIETIERVVTECIDASRITQIIPQQGGLLGISLNLRL